MVVGTVCELLRVLVLVEVIPIRAFVQRHELRLLGKEQLLVVPVGQDLPAHPALPGVGWKLVRMELHGRPPESQGESLGRGMILLWNRQATEAVLNCVGIPDCLKEHICTL